MSPIICKLVQIALACLFGAALVPVSTLAQAQPHVEGELNRGKAALQLKKFERETESHV